MAKKPARTELSGGNAEELDAGTAGAGAVAVVEGDGENAELDALIAQFGETDDVTVRLDRLRPESHAGYLGTLDLSGNFQDDVMREYGGGHYGGRVYAGSEYQRRIKFRIAGAPRDRGPVAVVAAPAPAVSDGLAAVLAEMARGNQRLGELIAAQGAAKSDVDPFAQFERVATVLKTVGAGNGNGGGSGDVLAIVDRVMGLQDKIAERIKANGGGGEENEFLAVMREGIVPILEMGRDYLAQRTGAAPRQLKPGETVDAVVQLAGRLPVIAKKFLAGKAKAGANPELYAEVALDQLSAGDKRALLDILSTEEKFGERIAAAVPDFNGAGEWFERFGVAAKAMLEVHLTPAAVPETKTKGGAGKGRTKKAVAT